MKIRSEFREVAGCQFEECLLDYSSKSIISKEFTHKQFQKQGKASCKLKLCSGICIIDSRLDLNRSVSQVLSVKGDFIQLSCILEGSAHLQLNQNHIKQQAGRIYISMRNNDQSFIKLPPVNTHYIIILISCSHFLELMLHEDWIKEDQFFKEIKAGENETSKDFNLPLEFPMYQILDDILSCNWEANKQLSYTEIKLRELFLQLSYQKDLNVRAGRNYSQDCIYKIQQARNFLTMNYHSPPTINALSRIVLLNEVQLKSGFKDLYGCTIRSYITELRMKRATVLLNEHTVNETAGLLGYKSVSHFISNFKKFHSKTPKQFLIRS